jgi:hypothetical protein
VLTNAHDMSRNALLSLEISFFDGFYVKIETFITFRQINGLVVPETDVPINTCTDDELIFEHDHFNSSIMTRRICIDAYNAFN